MQYAKPVTLNVEECDRLSLNSDIQRGGWLIGNQHRRAA